MGRTTIGLDIGATGVRAAELSFGSGGVALERLGQVPLPDGAVRDGEVLDAPAVAAALRQLWRAERFSHRHVVVGVANQRVVVRSVDLPEMPRADLERALPFQVADVLPMPVEEAVMDFHPLQRLTGPSGAAVQRGLLVAAWASTVQSHLAAVAAAGLHADVVDLSSFAVLRAVAAPLGSDVTTEALVDVGATVTQVVVHAAGVPLFVRILLRGGADITEALSERAGVPLADAEHLKRQWGLGGDGGETVVGHAVAEAAAAFVEEVRSTVDYATASQPGHRVQRVVLTGGGAQLDGLAARLATATGLPVELGSPTARVRAGRSLRDASLVGAACAVPVGLALGASA